MIAVLTHRADAQQPGAQDSTLDLGSILYAEDRGGLSISSGKTYNRVEGLPVFIGPTFRDRIGHANLSLAALGIIRSSNKFHWDAENLGHRLTADLRFGKGRGFAVGAASFDEVVKVEPWQLSEPDGGLRCVQPELGFTALCKGTPWQALRFVHHPFSCLSTSV